RRPEARYCGEVKALGRRHHRGREKRGREAGGLLAGPGACLKPCVLFSAVLTPCRSQKAKQEEAQKKKGRGRRPLLSKPVDDVYLTWYYERPSYNVEEAVGMLKKFQELDFTYPKQFVYINVTLDMELQKKKKVDQFASIVLLPYRFTDETNKVLVFTEVSKPELLIYKCHEPSILEEEIQMDFYIAVPAIMPKLIPLRSKLKQKYPSTRRNSLGHDIPKMLQFFREGLEYMVQDERLIKTRIARLDMPSEQIVANLKAIIEDICKFKPSSAGNHKGLQSLCGLVLLTGMTPLELSTKNMNSESQNPPLVIKEDSCASADINLMLATCLKVCCTLINGVYSSIRPA
uniref:Mitochondrial ribosomal protein L1 n=1 Tax=Phasianus colchicus TaxID=9054 RepID=A0A669QEP0_PHACC